MTGFARREITGAVGHARMRAAQRQSPLPGGGLPPAGRAARDRGGTARPADEAAASRQGRLQPSATAAPQGADGALQVDSAGAASACSPPCTWWLASRCSRDHHQRPGRAALARRAAREMPAAGSSCSRPRARCSARRSRSSSQRARARGDRLRELLEQRCDGTRGAGGGRARCALPEVQARVRARSTSAWRS